MHYYDTKGKARFFEGKANKKTSMWDVRRLLKAGDPIYPSVTSILKIIDKPFLTSWIAEEAAMAAGKVIQKTSSKFKILIDRSWARHILNKGRQETKAKAKIGSGIHDALELFVGGKHIGDLGTDKLNMCNAVYICLFEHCGEQPWITEQSFSNVEYGYGGKCDLHSDEWIIDYKSKDKVDETTKGYKDQAEQLAACAHGLDKPDARIANIFISRSPPAEGDAWAVKWVEYKDNMAFDRFKAALRMWSYANKYGPFFDRLEKAE